MLGGEVKGVLCSSWTLKRLVIELSLLEFS